MLGMVEHRNEKIYYDIYKELEEIAMEDEALKDAFKRWKELSLTQEELLAYVARAKRILDEEAVKREAELMKEEAMEQGLKEGIKEGRKEGEQIGRQEEKKAIARRLIAKGMDIDSISEVTGLEKEQILKMSK